MDYPADKLQLVYEQARKIDAEDRLARIDDLASAIELNLAGNKAKSAKQLRKALMDATKM